MDAPIFSRLCGNEVSSTFFCLLKATFMIEELFCSAMNTSVGSLVSAAKLRGLRRLSDAVGVVGMRCR